MQDVNEDLIAPDSPGGNMSNSSTRLTTKQFILVNISKFIVELVGTLVIGIFYALIGDKQAGMLLGMWIMTLFGQAISGAHFNPAVTLTMMIRKNSTFGKRRILGVMYIAAQICGGIASALLVIFLNGHAELVVPAIESNGNSKSTSAFISEILGTFFFCFMFMLCTEAKTQFSSDKVINCFIIASAYVSARTFSGGSLVTRDLSVISIPNPIVMDGLPDTIEMNVYKYSGPLLNPAIAFG